MEPLDLLRERQLKEPEIVAKERYERFWKAVELKEPDRVPLIIFTSSNHLLAKYYKLSEIYFNYDILIKATVKAANDFPVDLFLSSVGVNGSIFGIVLSNDPEAFTPFVYIVVHLTGPMHDVLGDKYTKWPGRELRENVPFQFIGGEFMKPDEYDELINNPADFIADKILPRVCTNLGKPGTPRYVNALIRLGIEAKRAQIELSSLGKEMAKIGYPSIPFILSACPLDIISDFLRHPTGVMKDCYRLPDKVRHAVESLLGPVLKMTLTSYSILKPTAPALALIPLHLNEMLPPKLYNEFYWPALKKIIIELLNRGIKSFVFFEGDHTPHLETLLELPKGWGLGLFEKGDIRKIKKVLEGHTCVVGGIPVSLLLHATPEKVEEYVKKLIEDTSPGGGLILTTGVVEIPPETPNANLIALINAVLKYGEYRK